MRNLVLLFLLLTPVVICGQSGIVNNSLMNPAIGVIGDFRANYYDYEQRKFQVQFEEAEIFSEGLAPVRISGKWGYIGRTGNFVIKPQFEKAEGFSEELAAVQVGPNRVGYVDKAGRMIVQPDYVAGWKFSRGRARVRKQSAIR